MILRVLRCNFTLKGEEEDEVLGPMEPPVPSREYAAPRALEVNQPVSELTREQGVSRAAESPKVTAKPSAAQVSDRVYVLIQEDLRLARLRGQIS